MQIMLYIDAAESYEQIGRMLAEREVAKTAISHTFDAMFRFGTRKLNYELKKQHTCIDKIKYFFCSKSYEKEYSSKPICQMIEDSVQRQSYIQAFGLIFAVFFQYQRLIRNKQFNQIYAKIVIVYNRCYKYLSNLEKIVYLERQNQLHRREDFTKCLLQAYNSEYQSFPSPSLRKTIEKIFEEDYRVCTEKNMKCMWVDYINFQARQSQPNIESIIKSSKNYKASESDLLFALINQKKIEQAWQTLLVLKKTQNQQYFLKYARILAMIDLHQYNVLVEYLNMEEFSEFQQNIIISTVKYQRQKFEDESGEDKIKNNLKYIQIYKQYACGEILVQAYRSTIYLLTLGHRFPDCLDETQQARNQRILQLYERMLDEIIIYQKKQRKRDVMSGYIASALRIAFKQSQPNYPYLLKMLEKYSFTFYQQCMICLCMKDFSRVKAMIEEGLINGENANSLEQIERMTELMERRKHEDLKKYVEKLENEKKVYESEKWCLWRKIVEISEKEEGVVSML